MLQRLFRFQRIKTECFSRFGSKTVSGSQDSWGAVTGSKPVTASNVEFSKYGRVTDLTGPKCPRLPSETIYSWTDGRGVRCRNVSRTSPESLALCPVAHKSRMASRSYGAQNRVNRQQYPPHSS